MRPDSCVVAEVRPSPNHGERKQDAKPDMIVLHYTGMPDAKAALAKLCTAGTEVSAHYLVMDDGHIVQCVPEARRAWHAGTASWAGEADINSCSIGIEIANPGHDHGYPDFPKRQIAAVTALCRSILTRYRIPAHRVLGHSDVAPTRKKDPGEKFPWRLLHESGIGLWVKPAPIVSGGSVFVLGENDPAITDMQALLGKYGYGISTSGHFDGATRDVIAAFQRHFRAAQVDGVADASTIATMKALLAARDAETSPAPPTPPGPRMS
jgi:N-acetylmuramoyl-L-alanine amidase